MTGSLFPSLNWGTLIGRWILQQTLHLDTVLFRSVIFVPLHWSASATRLFGISRDMAVALLAVAMCWGIIRAMWPVGGGGLVAPPGEIIARAVTALALGMLALPLIQWLLAVNNAIVGGLVMGPQSVTAVDSNLALYSPLLGIVMIGLTVCLLIYLGLFYALRSVEIFVLTALAPWVVLFWIISPGGGGMRRLMAELMVAIFVQSVHAAVFWLFVREFSQGTGVVSALESVGVLWYMTKIPGQLRRLCGLGGTGGRIWT